MKSKQETFDAVAAHFLTMKEPSISDTGMCKYRSADGNTCFAGALIPDDKYTVDLENHVPTVGLPLEVFGQLGYDAHFVRLLQQCHDTPSMDEDLRNGEWFAAAKERLLFVAARNNLNADLLERRQP